MECVKWLLAKVIDGNDYIAGNPHTRGEAVRSQLPMARLRCPNPARGWLAAQPAVEMASALGEVCTSRITLPRMKQNQFSKCRSVAAFQPRPVLDLPSPVAFMYLPAGGLAPLLSACTWERPLTGPPAWLVNGWRSCQRRSGSF